MTSVDSADPAQGIRFLLDVDGTAEVARVLASGKAMGGADWVLAEGGRVFVGVRRINPTVWAETMDPDVEVDGVYVMIAAMPNGERFFLGECAHEELYRQVVAMFGDREAQQVLAIAMTKTGSDLGLLFAGPK